MWADQYKQWYENLLKCVPDVNIVYYKIKKMCYYI